MRKSILIGVLAALMLFAFTACEPQTVTWPTTKDVSYLSIEQVKSFVKGEVATDDGFNAVIHYTDGTTEVVPGIAEVQDDNKTVKAAITFSGDQNATTAKDYEIQFDTVSDIAIAGVSNVEIVAGTKLSDIHDITTAVKNKDLSFTGEPVFTFTYANGTKSFTLADEVSGKFDYQLSVYEANKTTPMEATDTFAKGKTYSVKITGYELADGTMYPVDFTTDMTISVVDAAAPATVEAIKVYYTVKDGNTVVADKVATLPALYTGDTVEISVYEVKSDNTEALTKNAVSAVNVTAGSALSFTTGTATATVVTKTDKVSTTAAGTVQVKVGDKYFTAPYSVAAGDNYISAVSVDEAASKTVKVGETLSTTGDNSAITVTVTYKDESNKPSTVSGVNSTLSPSVVPSGVTGSFSTICTTTYTGRGGVAKSVQTPLTYTVGN